MRHALLALVALAACAGESTTGPSLETRREPLREADRRAPEPNLTWEGFCPDGRTVVDTLFVPLGDGTYGYVLEYFCLPPRWRH